MPKSEIKLEKQEQKILQAPIPEEEKKEEPGQEVAELKSDQLEEPQPDLTEENYLMFAKSIHGVFREGMKIMTKGKVDLEDDELNSLNECGVQLLKKYDKSGTLGEYSPEFIYGMTLLSVTSRLFVERKMQQAEEKSPEQKKAEEFVEKPKPEKKDNFNQVMKNV